MDAPFLALTALPDDLSHSSNCFGARNSIWLIVGCRVPRDFSCILQQNAYSKLYFWWLLILMSYFLFVYFFWYVWHTKKAIYNVIYVKTMILNWGVRDPFWVDRRPIVKKKKKKKNVFPYWFFFFFQNSAESYHVLTSKKHYWVTVR